MGGASWARARWAFATSGPHNAPTGATPTGLQVVAAMRQCGDMAIANTSKTSGATMPPQATTEDVPIAAAIVGARRIVG